MFEKETIRLEGDNDDFLSITLQDLLKRIDNLNSYHWKILWLDATSTRMNVVELEQTINDSEDGYPILGDELIPFAMQFQQIIELILIGDPDEANLKAEEDDETIKENCEFFIELIDSSYWEITTHNVPFLKRAKRDFK